MGSGLDGLRLAVEDGEASICLSARSATLRRVLAPKSRLENTVSHQPSTPLDPKEGATGKSSLSSDQATYNIVSDTFTGVNFRLKDNVLQAVFVFASVVIGAAAGAILAALNPRWNLPWFGGALFGSFLGLVVGVFASGIFLMIYRTVRHIRGKHD